MNFLFHWFLSVLFALTFLSANAHHDHTDGHDVGNGGDPIGHDAWKTLNKWLAFEKEWIGGSSSFAQSIEKLSEGVRFSAASRNADDNYQDKFTHTGERWVLIKPTYWKAISRQQRLFDLIRYLDPKLQTDIQLIAHLQTSLTAYIRIYDPTLFTDVVFEETSLSQNIKQLAASSGHGEPIWRDQHSLREGRCLRQTVSQKIEYKQVFLFATQLFSAWDAGQQSLLLWTPDTYIQPDSLKYLPNDNTLLKQIASSTSAVATVQDGAITPAQGSKWKVESFDWYYIATLIPEGTDKLTWYCYFSKRLY